LDHTQIQKAYWDQLASRVENPIACTHAVTADNKPMSEQVFAAVAKYLHANFLSELPGGEVLEIGCGNGLILKELELLLPKGKWALSGADVSSEMLARTMAPSATLYCCDAKNLPVAARQFDFIYLHSVVQYFDNDQYMQDVMQECTRLLKDGGSLCLLDVPMIWYKPYMVGTPRGIRHFLRTQFPALQRLYKRFRPTKTSTSLQTVVSNVNGTEVTLPVFNGYWADPDMFPKYPFEDISVQVQPYSEKPLGYRKFRFNVHLKRLKSAVVAVIGALAAVLEVEALLPVAGLFGAAGMH
jgi:ubiquinone/menaquinone biosynthesis C-methylase UbiE